MAVLSSAQSMHKASRFSLVALLVALIFIGASPSLCADDTRIAVVDMGELLEKSPQSQTAETQLKASFSERETQLVSEQKRIQQLDSELKNLIDTGALSGDEKLRRERELRDLQRNNQRALDDFREEVRIARDIAIDRVQRDIIQAIAQVREREKLDLVLRENQYVVASTRIDITSMVMQVLEQAAQQPALPTDSKQ